MIMVPSIPLFNETEMVEEGEITLEEQEESERRRRTKIEVWKEKERREREMKAREWKVNNAKREVVNEKEGRIGRLRSNSNGMGSPTISLIFSPTRKIGGYQQDLWGVTGA